MQRADQRKISKNLVLVKKTVQKDLDTIVDRLVEEEIFTPQVREEIYEAVPRLPQHRCGLFISQLLRAGPHAFGIFRKILEERGFSHLVNVMENSSPSSSNDEANRWIAEREKTFVIDTVQPKPNRQKKDNTRPPVTTGQLERMMTLVFLSSLEEEREVDDDDGEYDKNLNLLSCTSRNSTFVM